MTQANIIQKMLKDSAYHPGLFSHDEITALGERVLIKVVRQLYATRLVHRYGYPKNRLAFKYPVTFGKEKVPVNRPETSGMAK